MKRGQRQSINGFCNSNCPICGNTRADDLFHTRDYNWSIPGTFKYVKCIACNLVYENPRPSEDRIMELYPRFYGTNLHDSSVDKENKIEVAVHRIRAAAIEAFRSKETIFDIGCGSGFFLEYMRRRGWKVFGVDASEEHIECAQKHLGLKGVQRAKWPLTNTKSIQVDVVTMFHVIEHLLLPREGLVSVHDVLLSGGILVLETPNAESWPARIFGRRWVTLDAPRHLNLFSKTTLKLCVEKAGFEILKLHTYSPSTMEYTESVRYALQDLGLRLYRNNNLKQVPESSNLDHSLECAHSRTNNVMKDRLLAFERKVYRTFNTIADRHGAGCNLLLVARKTFGS